MHSSHKWVGTIPNLQLKCILHHTCWKINVHNLLQYKKVIFFIKNKACWRHLKNQDSITVVLKNGCQSADGGKLTLLPSLHHKLHSKPADPLDNPWKTIQKGRWTPTVSLLTTPYVIGFVQLTWTLHVPLILLNLRPPDQTLYTLIPFKHYEYSNYDPCYISETA